MPVPSTIRSLPPDASRPLAAPPTVGQLFVGFLMLGLMGFGGVLPLSRRVIVEDRRWLSEEDFLALFGLCQFLPGGTALNISVAVGLKFRGIAGGLAAIAGLITAPTLIVIGLGTIYDRFQDDPHVRHVFLGLAAAAAGLLIALAVKIVLPLRKNPAGLAIAALCVVAIAAFKLPLLPTMAVLALAGVLAAGLSRAQGAST